MIPRFSQARITSLSIPSGFFGGGGGERVGVSLLVKKDMVEET